MAENEELKPIEYVSGEVKSIDRDINHKNDLIMFSGMVSLLIVVCVISYWVPDLRIVAAAQIGNVIGSGTTYIRGK